MKMTGGSGGRGRTEEDRGGQRLPVNFILDVAVVRGLPELGVGGEGAVDDDRQEESHHHLQPPPHLPGQEVAQPRPGQVQLGQEAVQVGEEERLDGEQVGEGEQGERHLLLAEGGDAGVGLAGVAAPPDGQATHEEEDDGGREVEPQDDHGGLVHVNAVELLAGAERQLG